MAAGPCFYLMGMGRRRKLVYRFADHALVDAFTGHKIRQWRVSLAAADRPEYSLHLITEDEEPIRLYEDEEGLWVDEGAGPECLSPGRVSLPRFDDHPNGALLRALHHELLVNIVAGAPVPNLFVYPQPWYRDAAMVLMCLKRTSNLPLVADWVGGLSQVFDRNNWGHEEPDNLGQVLYMISLVSEATHPLVESVLARVGDFRRGDHIVGSTDGADHPVYQTKWLKYGLRSLDLEDPYRIPEVADSYSALFWMDFRKEHVPCPDVSAEAAERYPYLAWAEANFRSAPPPMKPRLSECPITWEAHASQARYRKMSIVSEEWAERKVAAPHTWHAAEMFLYYWYRTDLPPLKG